MQTGMNLEKSLQYFSKKFSGDFSDEIKKVILDLNYGQSLKTALDKANTRLGFSGFWEFYQSIVQAQKLGTSIAETLMIQAEMIRTQTRQKAEEISRKASVKIAIPLVFCIFPALLVIYLAPAILRFYSSGL
jgi:tight adherence protein C